MEFEKQLNRIKKGQVSLVYLVQGKEPYLQEVARKVFLDTIVAPEDQDLNVGRFNMDEVSIQTAVQDAESVPFFGDRRLVMIDNPTFLTGEKEKKSIDHQLDRLQAYLENPMDSSVMVFFAPYEKLDQRKKNRETVEEGCRSSGCKRTFRTRCETIHQGLFTFATIWHSRRGVKHFTPQNTILAYYLYERTG